MVSIAKNVIGWAASAKVQCGIAMTAHTHETQKIVHANLFSRLGSFHADVNVGMEPRNTTLKIVTIPKTGSLKTCQSTIPRTAPPRQNLSSFVQPGVPYFRASTATTHAPRTAPRIWPLTVSLKNIPARVMVSKLAHMSHVAFTGFVSFRRMART